MTCGGFLEMNLTGSPRILSERIFRKLNAINSHVIIRWDDKSSFIFLIYDFIQLKLKKAHSNVNKNGKFRDFNFRKIFCDLDQGSVGRDG